MATAVAAHRHRNAGISRSKVFSRLPLYQLCPTCQPRLPPCPSFAATGVWQAALPIRVGPFDPQPIGNLQLTFTARRDRVPDSFRPALDLEAHGRNSPLATARPGPPNRAAGKW